MRKRYLGNEAPVGIPELLVLLAIVLLMLWVLSIFI